MSSMGVCKSTRKIASHKGPAHKLSIKNNNPHEVLTVGEDGYIFNIDIRTPTVDKLVSNASFLSSVRSEALYRC